MLIKTEGWWWITSKLNHEKRNNNKFSKVIDKKGFKARWIKITR